MIQESKVQTDLFVLVMEGANVVLGVQWLETLGDIIINHKNLTMEFTLSGKRILWKGEESLGRTHLSEGASKEW